MALCLAAIVRVIIIIIIFFGLKISMGEVLCRHYQNVLFLNKSSLLLIVLIFCVILIIPHG
jgi:hypothetical protein